MYFRNLFSYIRQHAHGQPEDKDRCEFLLSLMSTLLTTNIEELQVARQANPEKQLEYVFERDVIYATQGALDTLGAVEAIVDVIARAGPDISKASPLSRATAEEVRVE